MKKPYHIFFNAKPLNRLKSIMALLSLIILTCFMHLSLFAVAPAKPGHPASTKAVAAGNTLDKIGLSGGTPAAAAYSLRQLSSAYTGPLIRVRAGTTNAEADVAFDNNSTLSAASVVTVTLAGTSGFSIGQAMPFSTFYGAQDVFVTTWYDQSGNALNFTQTYLSEQPAIVQAGVMVMLNNKPNILFGASYLVVPGATIFTAGASMVGVAKGTATRPSSFITKCNSYLPAPFDFTDVNGYFFEGDGTNYVQLLNPVLSNTTPRSDVSIAVPESVYSFTIANQGNFFYYWNGASISSNTSTAFADIGSDMLMGNRQDGFGSGNFYSPEIVLFNSVLSDADRHTVEASQTAYYQVPPPTPLIFLSGIAAVSGNITVFPGTPSASPDNGQISVSGSWLTGNITATASAGFEVSLSAGSGYAGSVALTPTSGTLAKAIVYVRTTTAAPVSNLTGNVVLTSANATSQTVGVTVTPYPLPTINTVASQTLLSGTATRPVNFTGTGPTFNWASSPAIGLPATGSGNIGPFTAVNNGATPIISTITATPVYPKVKYVISGPGPGVVQATDGLTGNILDTLTYVRLYYRGGNGALISPYYASSIVVSADEGRLFIAQPLGILAIINTSTNQAIGNIPENGYSPVAMSVSTDGNTAYVLDHTLGMEVSVMNTVASTIIKNIPVPNQSTAMSISSDGAFVYVVNPANITVISTATNAVVGTVPLGSVALLHNKTTTGESLSGTPITFTITVNLSNNANLANFTTGSGALSTVFTSATTNYTETVTHPTEFFTVTPTTSDPNATIKVNGVPVASGTACPPIYLEVGANYIHSVVTAQDGTVRTYTVVVTRISDGLSTDANLSNLTINAGTLSPVFVLSTTNYTDLVSNAITYVQVTPTTSDVNATVKVNGTSVTSGTPSVNLPLIVGNNPIHAVVLAQDGTQRTYTITVTRAPLGDNNSLYLPGTDVPTSLVSSFNDKVIANNILTPNGDGVNDIWMVKNIANYPNNRVTVYDRTGNVVFTKQSYTNDWAGTYHGSVLNEGTYYYLVDLGNGKTMTGFITVVRDR